MKMFKRLKSMFCKHDWEIVMKNELFFSLRGRQLYKRCNKCGKVKKWIYLEHEGAGYK